MAGDRTPQRIRGTQDIFGEDQRRFGHVIDTFERVRRLYAFQRVELPVFEATGVFARSMGETSDVVSKEMYSFEDRGGDSITLRPEFTAGIARAYITEGWQQHAPLKIATHGPVFRYERPQKGRYRQFHQIDAEVIGAAEPQADVELLALADQLLKELGIAEGVTLQLNTLGDEHSRTGWRFALVDHFANFAHLSSESRMRLERNPLRILDSKDPEDREAIATAPDIEAFLTPFARDFFDAVRRGLDNIGVEYVWSKRLVRGLDYYRHTAFEFVTDRLGAQGTVLAGGRYDGLIGALGGPETPGVGWAAGIERLAMLVPDRRAREKQLDLVVVPESDALLSEAMAFVAAYRQSGRPADIIARGSPKKRGQKAGDLQPRCLVFFAEDFGRADRYRIVIKTILPGVREDVLWRRIVKCLPPFWSVDSNQEVPEVVESLRWEAARLIVRRKA